MLLSINRSTHIGVIGDWPIAVVLGRGRRVDLCFLAFGLHIPQRRRGRGSNFGKFPLSVSDATLTSEAFVTDRMVSNSPVGQSLGIILESSVGRDDSPQQSSSTDLTIRGMSL